MISTTTRLHVIRTFALPLLLRNITTAVFVTRSGSSDKKACPHPQTSEYTSVRTNIKIAMQYNTNTNIYTIGKACEKGRETIFIIE